MGRREALNTSKLGWKRTLGAQHLTCIEAVPTALPVLNTASFSVSNIAYNV